jgi:exonuclease 1
MFLSMCILSGCDYLESIKGIGIKKAFKFINENGEDIKLILKKIANEGRYQVPIDYQTLFQKAMLTFKFQVVYDPLREQLVHLNNPETHPLGALLINYPDLNFLG